MERRRTRTGRLSLILVSVALVTLACGNGDISTPAGQGPAVPQQAAQVQWNGVVLETMDADRYTYVRVDVGEEEIWVAAPRFEVAVGDQILVPPGAPMKDFFSQSMDRTFETIYFVESLGAGGGEPGETGMPPGHPAVGAPADTETTAVADIAPAEGGVTVAEVHERKVDLAGQVVTLRGKVVKVNQGILGANWLHIQDGSGAAGEGTNDLTVTTADIAEVGQLVVISGVLELDRNFGAGYRYAVIVTDARVTVE